MARAGQPSNFSNEIKQAMLPRSINKGAGTGSDDAVPPASANDANNFNGKSTLPSNVQGKGVPPKRPFAKKGAA